MKKIFFLIVSGLLIAGSVSAQYYTPRRGYTSSVNTGNSDDFYTPRIGIELGANLANTVSEYNANFSTNTLWGMQGGLTLSLPLIYPLSIEAEGIYSQKAILPKPQAVILPIAAILLMCHCC